MLTSKRISFLFHFRNCGSLYFKRFRIGNRFFGVFDSERERNRSLPFSNLRGVAVYVDYAYVSNQRADGSDNGGGFPGGIAFVHYEVEFAFHSGKFGNLRECRFAETLRKIEGGLGKNFEIRGFRLSEGILFHNVRMDGTENRSLDAVYENGSGFSRMKEREGFRIDPLDNGYLRFWRRSFKERNRRLASGENAGCVKNAGKRTGFDERAVGIFPVDFSVFEKRERSGMFRVRRRRLEEKRGRRTPHVRIFLAYGVGDGDGAFHARKTDGSVFFGVRERIGIRFGKTEGNEVRLHGVSEFDFEIPFGNRKLCGNRRLGDLIVTVDAAEFLDDVLFYGNVFGSPPRRNGNGKRLSGERVFEAELRHDSGNLDFRDFDSKLRRNERKFERNGNIVHAGAVEVIEARNHGEFVSEKLKQIERSRECPAG